MTGLHPRHRLIQSILVALFLGGPLAACSRSKEPETAAAQDPVAPEAGLGAGRRAEGGPVAREPAPAAPRSADAKPKAKGDAKLAQRAVGERDPAVATSMPERESEEDAMSPGWNRQDFNTEGYDHLVENRFVSVASAPLSTFSIDVDTASYSNVRRFLRQGTKPPLGAVRIEELVNYFDYQYEGPLGDEPLSVHTELSTAPWAPEHRLLHIGLQGRRIALENLPARNLTFLLDVSGSMEDANKLPLLKRSLHALLETMGERDTVSIVVYAGASGMVLPPTRGDHKSAIMGALDRLSAGGSTNGGEGIELAYRLASRNYRADGVNRVILATDGDFNIGTTSRSELVELIERERESGVFLTVLGFGMGNYKDSTLEQLADKGNGNYAYIDSYGEARKVLVEEAGANLVAIAKDVKIQVEMNPTHVGAYRLIGYENRSLLAEDFADDKKDAGEIGAGHTVTAIYELLSPEQAARELDSPPLRYQKAVPREGGQDELLTLKVRFKAPQGTRSRLVQFAVSPHARPLAETSDAFRFSAAVASFGMLLRGSEYAGEATYGSVESLARGALGRDPGGYRSEFLGLIHQAAQL